MARRAKNTPVLDGEIVASGPAASDLVDGSPLLSTEDSVLWHAGVLRSAIEAARADGYVVQMPFRVEDLGRIAVSATAKANSTA